MSEEILTLSRAQELVAARDINTFLLELTGEEVSESLGRLFNYCDIELADGFDFEEVYSEGGGEGGGEYVERVWEIKYGGTHIAFVRTIGSYYSHDGIYWSGDFWFCEPKEVVVVEYTNVV
jgi:hypothetical protein